MVHILTHNDLDGYAAGYVVSDHFQDEKCEITILNYDKEPDIESYKKGDTVVITDYSLTNEQYGQILKLIGKTGKLIWCDHHKTAIDRYDETSNPYVGGLRSTKYCGAVLAWCYFNGMNDTIIETTPYDIFITRIPRWLRYIDAWDTWKLDSKYREGAEALNLAVQSNLSIELMAELEDSVREYIHIGKTYMDFRDSWSKAFRDQYMFHKILSGKQFGTDRELRACILTLGNANSQYFGDEIDKSDVCITQCFDGEKWKVSIYSNKKDVDCGMYCKAFGGGGHKGAAGCYFKQLHPPGFKDENIEILHKELYNINTTDKKL